MQVEIKETRTKLMRLFELIARQAEQDPDFALALSELFESGLPKDRKKRVNSQLSPSLDPFDAFQLYSADEFKTWLEGLSVEQLRAMVRKHRFDPSRLSDRWKTKQRFIDLIIERVGKRSTQGEVFREYSKGDKRTNPEVED